MFYKLRLYSHYLLSFGSPCMLCLLGFLKHGLMRYHTYGNSAFARIRGVHYSIKIWL